MYHVEEAVREIRISTEVPRFFRRHDAIFFAELMVYMNSSCVDDSLQFEQTEGSDVLDTKETILSESRAPVVRASSLLRI